MTKNIEENPGKCDAPKSNDMYLEKAGTMIVPNAAEDQMRLCLATKISSMPLGKQFHGVEP